MSDKCMVCETITEICCPSPFFPYSGWRCAKCINAHRIPYNDALLLLKGKGSNYDEVCEEWYKWWGSKDGYLEKYLLPTIEFFNKTKEEVWAEAQVMNLENFG